MKIKEEFKLNDNELKNVNGGVQDINGIYSFNAGDCFSHQNIMGVDIVRFIVLETYIDVPAYTLINLKIQYMNDDGTIDSEAILDMPACHDFLDKNTCFRGNGIWQ